MPRRRRVNVAVGGGQQHKVGPLPPAKMASAKQAAAKHKKAAPAAQAAGKAAGVQPVSKAINAAPPRTPRVLVSVPATVPTGAGNAGIVMLLAALLFVLSQRKGITPFFQVWAGQKGQVETGAANPLMLVGAIVFIVILGIIASTSSDMTAVLLVMLFAMWLLWLVLGGGGEDIGFILKSISPTPAASTAGSTTAQGGKK